MKIAFYLDSKLDYKNRKTIFIRLSNSPDSPERFAARFVDGGNIKIKESFWNKEAQRVKRTHDFCKLINNRLDNIEDELTLETNRIRREGLRPTPKRIRLRFGSANEVITPEVAIDEWVKKKRKEISESALKNVTECRKRILELTPIYWDSFDEDFIDRFKRKSWGQSTLFLRQSALIEFLKFCVAKGWTTSEKFKLWKTSKGSYDQIALTTEEVSKVFLANLSDPKLILTRDIFLWCIFSSMRIMETQGEMILQGDLLTFKKSKTRINNAKYHTIRMNSILIEIWERYDGAPKFKHLCQLNKRIREICRIAGIDTIVETKKGMVPKWQAVSSHSGRRTFVSMSRAAGGALGNIQIAVGHSTQEMTAKYDKSGAVAGFGVMDMIEENIIKGLREN